MVTDASLVCFCLQSDVLLGILGEINGQGPPIEGPESIDITHEDGGDSISPSGTDSSAATATVVGTTAADMESIKELIRFDHVYFKRPTEKVIAVKEETKDINKSADSPLPHNNVIVAPEESFTDFDQSSSLDFLLSLDSKDAIRLSNPFATSKCDSANAEDNFDCDISSLLTCEDLDMCDSLSDSGKSTGSSADSGVMSDEAPSSPDFVDPLGSPVLPNCDWEDSFIDLFPSLDM